jgi:hypothetical protein
MPTHKIARLAWATARKNAASSRASRAKRTCCCRRSLAKAACRVEQIYAMFPNLKERAPSQGTRLSGGEQQMLAVARILRTGAKLLLLDEISEGLAPVIVQKLAEMVIALRKQGYTVVMVEQNFRFAAPLADRFYGDGARPGDPAVHAGRIAENAGACTNTWASRIARDRSIASISPARTILERRPNENPNPRAPAWPRLATTRFGARLAQAQAQISGDVIRIGFITDLSGVYSDIDGQGGIEAIKMAIADLGGKVAGKKIELVTPTTRTSPTSLPPRRANGSTARRGHADRRHQFRHRPGDGQGRGREEEALHRDRSGTSALTNEQCTPYTMHYAYDTIALAKGTGGAVTKAGGKTWYFLTGRLRVRQARWKSRHRTRGEGQRRQGARRGQASAVGERLFVVPAAGAGEQGADPGPGQRRRRHDQLDQGGQ